MFCNQRHIAQILELYVPTRIMLIFLIGVILCCAPDHDNPYDPESPFFDTNGYLVGQAKSYYAPNIGLPDVQLSIIQTGQSVQSQSGGYFEFQSLTAGIYQLTARRQHYAPDTVIIQIWPHDTTHVQIRLDGLPVFSEVNCHTHFKDQWSEPSYEVHFEVQVNDIDGPTDLDSVFVQIPAVNIQTKLNYNPIREIFELILFEDDLSPFFVNELVGSPIFFSALDLVGNWNKSEAYFLTRVIEQTPIPLSPVDRDTVGARPYLVWLPYPYRFPVQQQIEVYRTITGIPVFIWDADSILSESDSIQVDFLLDEASYFWTIAAIDQFGNLARSKESPFIVNED